MIVTENGRSRSVRTEAEEDARLEREIANLTPGEAEALAVLLKDLETGFGGKEDTLLQLVNRAEFKREPVDMETFVMDPYFLGNTCETLYEVHMKDLEELFSGGYQEAIWTGAIGSGKTFAASIGVCRVFYEMSCMVNPHKSFGLAPGSNISIACLSVNEGLAMKVAFDNIATKIKASPYFQTHYKFKPTKKEFRFPDGVWLAARATTDTSVLGLNLIGAFIDEANFMRKGKVDKRFNAVDHVETIYTGIKRRIKSRFERRGKLPGMIFLVSSKKTQEDFTARRIRAAVSDPSVFVRDYALWDVKPEDYYSAAHFFVLCGNEQIPSRMLPPEQESEVPQLKKTLPDGVSLIKVPEDFRLDFTANLEGAIRDIGGISTVAVSPFIQRREKLTWTDRPHAFSVLVYDPSKPGKFLWDQLVQKVQTRDWSGAWEEKLVPIVNPTSPRHVHIDPAYRKDSVGFCLSHISHYVDVRRRTDDGEVYQERAPFFYVDFILKIVPPLGDEIVLGDLRRLVYTLSAHGFPISLTTLDTWQSVDSIQQLKAKGYRAEHLSVDTRMDPYENLKTAFYEDRIDVYDYPPLFAELQKLEKDETRNKVDHPSRGSKDVSDALAGCTWTLKENKQHAPLPIMHGISEYDDTWMAEQQAHSAANAKGGNSGRYFPQPAQGGTMGNHAPLPFLGGGLEDSPGGGWDPRNS